MHFCQILIYNFFFFSTLRLTSLAFFIWQTKEIPPEINTVFFFFFRLLNVSRDLVFLRIFFSSTSLICEKHLLQCKRLRQTVVKCNIKDWGKCMFTI